jgi:hypothetical protein
VSKQPYGHGGYCKGVTARKLTLPLDKSLSTGPTRDWDSIQVIYNRAGIHGKRAVSGTVEC